MQTNLESQRRQYDLVELARLHGLTNVEVIDDDLGRSAGGSVARPGFDVAVGAVLCLDASRLARNGRNWHHLLELCDLVGARVIDTEGIYDPHRPNDRLLLAMPFLARLFAANLRISVRIGYTWHRELGLGLDPNLRVQEAARVVFRCSRVSASSAVHGRCCSH